MTSASVTSASWIDAKTQKRTGNNFRDSRRICCDVQVSAFRYRRLSSLEDIFEQYTFVIYLLRAFIHAVFVLDMFRVNCVFTSCQRCEGMFWNETSSRCGRHLEIRRNSTIYTECQLLITSRQLQGAHTQ